MSLVRSVKDGEKYVGPGWLKAVDWKALDPEQRKILLSALNAAGVIERLPPPLQLDQNEIRDSSA